MRNRKEVETDWYGDPSPADSNRQRYVTYEETEDYLVNHIRGYFTKSLTSGYSAGLRGYPTLTVHRCWSGYSEYTVTDTWDEIEINWGDHHAFFESTSAFFRALADSEEQSW